MSVFLRLLSTDHCSLCDEALSMLFSMPDIAGLELRVVDVVSDENLLRDYGERVPVLQLFTSDDQADDPTQADEPTDERDAALVLELGWPFSPETIGSALRGL